MIPLYGVWLAVVTVMKVLVSKKYRVRPSTFVNAARNAVELPGDQTYLLKIRQKLI